MRRTLPGLALAALTALCCLPAQAQEAPLWKARRCDACHAIERKLIGPSFRDIAARHQGNAAMVEPLALKMHESSGDFPPDVGEPGYLGLKLAPSVEIRTPRLADAPWAMECRTWQVINVKDDRQLVIGEGLDG